MNQNNPSKPVDEGGDVVFFSGMEKARQGKHPSDAILEQEERGQKQLIASNAIPTEWALAASPRERQQNDESLKKMGFEVGEPFEDDPLFRPAKLPEGWQKKGSDHAMHSSIIDDKGFERVFIFYKAAFYDRRADMSLDCRIRIATDARFRASRSDKRQVNVEAKAPGEEVIILASFEGDWGPIDPQSGENSDYLARKWIEERFPDYENPLAYWELEFDGERYNPRTG